MTLSALFFAALEILHRYKHIDRRLDNRVKGHMYLLEPLPRPTLRSRFLGFQHLCIYQAAIVLSSLVSDARQGLGIAHTHHQVRRSLSEPRSDNVRIKKPEYDRGRRNSYHLHPLPVFESCLS